MNGANHLLWMDEILHHFETMLVGIYRGIVIPGFLRWCKILSTHSINWCRSSSIHSIDDDDDDDEEEGGGGQLGGPTQK